LNGEAIRVRGLVQGVGFRPHVWRVARAHGVRGDVRNDGGGVLIHAWGDAEALAAFRAALREEAPPLARIDAIEVSAWHAGMPDDFRIVVSGKGEIATFAVPDAATCPACLAEVLDAGNRRHSYAFTNCSHCGPRLSILRALPYDRAHTAMSVFPLCEACAAEYADPADRRFHAEPNACPACGPRLSLVIAGSASGEAIRESPSPPPGLLRCAGDDEIGQAAEMLRAGKILAIKGLGGFHLACDATNPTAIATLRARKRRPHKPLALMARDLGQIGTYAELSDAEAALLASQAAPIVVLAGRANLPEALAPGQSTLGFMLPNTPLHHLLLRALDSPIVLTSGNPGGSPQCTGNDEARTRLGAIADAFLLHDRAILNRLDDSVARVVRGAPSLLRRARGYAPAPLQLAQGFADAPRVLALGAELKSTFCLLHQGQAILSQHIGDLENAEIHAEFRKALALYRQMFGFAPEIVAVDAHPDYLSTRHGQTLGVTVQTVAHHHAHVAAVLGEHGYGPNTKPVLGIVLDGLGMGEDGTLWGGEFLLADFRSARRLAHFDPVAMPGGARAVREPWRNAFAHLSASLGWENVVCAFGDLPAIRLLRSRQPQVLARMIESGLNTPRASSAGRLFDAAAFLLGLCDGAVSYEGQAAMALEALAGPVFASAGGVKPDRFAVLEPGFSQPVLIGWAPLWRAFLADLAAGVDRAHIAARFHRGVIAALIETTDRLRTRHEFSAVVLSGGVFQNRLLLESTADALESRGLTALLPACVPANDGGIALGQALIAAAIETHGNRRPSPH
jgi:hydrogenase maturation protein HypF